MPEMWLALAAFLFASAAVGGLALAIAALLDWILNRYERGRDVGAAILTPQLVADVYQRDEEDNFDVVAARVDRLFQQVTDRNQALAAIDAADRRTR